MSAVAEAEGPRPQDQKTLEGWAVAKVPQWTKEGLMEHIVELVVVDDQVRNAKLIYVLLKFTLTPRGTQAFSVVDRMAFRRLLKFQRPATKDADIPHRTSVAKAVHAKSYKVKDILKDLFAVSVVYIVLLRLRSYVCTEHPWGSISNIGRLVITSP